EAGQVAVGGVPGEPGYSAVATGAMLRGTGKEDAGTADMGEPQHRPPEGKKARRQIAKLSCVEGGESSSGNTSRDYRPWAWWWRRKTSSTLRLGESPYDQKSWPINSRVARNCSSTNGSVTWLAAVSWSPARHFAFACSNALKTAAGSHGYASTSSRLIP